MKPKRPDKYDRQIARLKKQPELIPYEWGDGKGLFAVTGQDCGCLTQIRASEIVCAPTPELTNAIRGDKKIPTFSGGITAAHLPRFAYWQRKIDRMGVRK